MTKKILAMFLAVMMVISLLPTSALAVDPACPGTGNDHTSENCTDYQIIGLVEATCTADGGTKARCNHCGDEFLLLKTANKDESKHSWGEEIAEVKPNCTSDGVKAYKLCKHCGKISYKDGEETKISADKATWNGATEKWELAESQKTALKIEKTGTGHSFVNPDPSKVNCEVGGEFIKVCEHCGVKDDASNKVTLTAGTAHTWDGSTFVLNADGTKGEISCSACGVKKDVTVADSHDHKWIEVAGVAASCTKPGVKQHRYCAYEGCTKVQVYDGSDYKDLKQNEKVEIAPEDHTFADLKCNTESAICADCNLAYGTDVLAAYIAKLPNKGHDFDGETFTCNEEGTLACVNCEGEITAEQAGATRPNHTYKPFVSCTDTEKECKDCQKKTALTTEEKTGHDWKVEGVEANPCDNPNAKCTICEKTSLQLGLGQGNHKLPDEYSKKDNAEPNCTTAVDGVKKCEYCGKVITAKNYFPATEHNVVTYVIPGNCQTEAVTIKYCLNENCPNTAENAELVNALLLGVKYDLSAKIGDDTICAWIDDWGSIVWSAEDPNEEGSDTYIKAEWKLEAVEGGFNAYCIYNFYDPEYSEETLELKLYLIKGLRGLAASDYDTPALIKFETVGNCKTVMTVDGKIFQMEKKTSGETTYYTVKLVDDEKVLNEENVFVSLKAVAGETIKQIEKTTAEEKDDTCHTEAKWVVDSQATCYRGTEGHYVCKNCNEVLTDTIVLNDARNHEQNGEEHWVDATSADLENINKVKGFENYTAVSKASTCEVKGWKIQKCGHEGCIGHYQVVELELADHTWATTKPVATHENQQVAWKTTCITCGAASDDYVEWDHFTYNSFADATTSGHHTFDSGENACTVEEATAATCTEDGVKTFTCDVCKKTVTIKVSKLGHDWATVQDATGNATDGMVLDRENSHKDPTCITDGYKYSWGCKREGCDVKHPVKDGDNEVELGKYVVIPATGKHNYVETEAFEEADVTANSKPDYDLIWKKCDCDTGCTETIKAFAKITEKTDAKLCTEYNYEVYTFCGELYVRNVVGKIGHVWAVDDSYSGKTSANCSVKGQHAEYCILCNPSHKNDEDHEDSYKIVIDEKIPEHINDEGVKFTEVCGNDKIVTNRDCVICDREDIGTSHNLKETKHEVCGTQLYYSYDCEYCDYSERTDDLGLVKHNASDEDVANKPEATYEDQTWTYTCTRCEQEITEIVNLKGMHLVVDGKEFTYGSLITVTVRLDNVKADLASYCFDFKFNSANVALVGYKNLVDGFAVNIDTQTANTTGTLTLAGAYIKDTAFSVDGDVELIELTFRVKTNAAGDLVFSYAQNSTSEMFFDSEGEKVEIKLLEEQKVTVKRRVLGDFNNNNVMDINDVREALGMITYENPEKSYDVTMDVNFDGEFTAADVQILLELLSIENDAKRNEAINALVREAMGEEHAALCFELHHCGNSDCGNTYYEDFKYCPDCGHITVV